MTEVSEVLQQNMSDLAAKLAAGEGTLDDYVDWTDTLWVTKDKPFSHDMAHAMAGFAEEGGEVIGVLKKAIRDGGLLDHGKLGEERRNQLRKEMGDQVYYLARLCRLANISLTSVFTENVLKLEGRRMRDTLRGSGDDR